MSTTGGFGRFGHGLLMKKLDMAMQTLARAKEDDHLSDAEKRAAHDLEGHVPVYAGLVSDVQAKRINATDPTVGKLLGLAEEFCSVVASTFSVAPVPRAS